MSRENFFQRPFSALPIPYLGLAAGEVEQRIGYFGAIGIGVNQLLLLSDGALIILQRGMRIADPVLRVGRQWAAGVSLQEVLKPRDGGLVVADFKEIES